MATWPATTHELIRLQQAFGELTPEPWRPPATLSRIGACFVCFERGVLLLGGMREGAGTLCTSLQ